MKVTIVPIVIGAFGTVTKELWKCLEDLEVGRRVETIQMTALLKTTRILRRFLETWGDLLSLKLQWKKPSADADVKIAKGIIIIIISLRTFVDMRSNRFTLYWIGQIGTLSIALSDSQNVQSSRSGTTFCFCVRGMLIPRDLQKTKKQKKKTWPSTTHTLSHCLIKES